MSNACFEFGQRNNQLPIQITSVSLRHHLPSFRRRCFQDMEDEDNGRGTSVTRSRQVVVGSRENEPI